VTHAGGNLNFTGSFTAGAGVSVGDYISATATRKTSGVTYDITSEFSATVQAIAAADPLIVTSTADTDTLGTLRYAINHANANSSDDNITFDIPNSDGGYNAGRGVWQINLLSALPNITDNGITIDATSQTTNQGNTNAGNIVAATTVGVNNTPIAAVAAPEIEIRGPQSMLSGFVVDGANNTAISGLAILGSQTGIQIRNGAAMAVIDGVVIGSYANSIADPGSGNRVDNGISIDGNNTQVTVQNSAFANAEDGRAVVVGGFGTQANNSVTVDGVHFI